MADIRDRDIRARSSFDPRFDRVRPAAKKAQDAAKSKEKQGGDTKSNTLSQQEGPEVYRYPREALSDTTDALFISIFEQIRTSQIFGIGEPIKPGTSIDITKIGEIPNYTDYFRGPKSADARAEKTKKTNIQHIYLPIPQQISDALAVAYGEDTLNPIQSTGLRVAAGIIDNPKKVVQNATNVAQQIFKGNIEGIDEGTKKGIQSIFGATALNQLGANINPNSLLSRASGQILQSNLELLFSGVTLRSFPFLFDFAPRDQTEAKEVMMIIRALKSAMVPKKGNSLFIQAPKVFQLEYITGQQAHPFLNKFKLCSLTDMAVNYTASGTYATYADGTPVHIQVQCTFKEINPVYAEDYDAKYTGPYAPGNDPANFGVGY